MRIGVVKEVHPGECRVAATPHTVRQFADQGFAVVVERGAGERASYPDELYAEAGAELAVGAAEIWRDADIVVKVRPPGDHPALGHEADHARGGQVVVSLVFPGQNQELVQRLADRKVTLLALDCIPRTTRAQAMDVLSSMANIAGYRAVVEAASHFGSFFTGQHTAAGSVPPARVLVIGAGVAGLAAIAAARGLGAVVRAFDTRAAAREQVESLGGEFLELHVEESGEGAGGYAKVMSQEFIAAEMALFLEQAREVDIVITTALIPGKKAPTLWTDEHVAAMKPGSVVVDLAAEQGGNCEATRPGEVTRVHDVTVIGYGDLPSRMAHVSSDLFGTNLAHFTKELGGAEHFTIDHDDEIVRGALVLEEGQLLWPPPKPAEPSPPPAERDAPEPAPAPIEATEDSMQPAVTSGAAADVRSAARGLLGLVALALVGGWVYLRFGASPEALGPSTALFLQHLTVFVLACFVGWQVVWNVTAALHTPLMSVTNAISGIIIVGGILQATGAPTDAPVLIGAIATLFASINIFGGFTVTQRMLQMFRK